jgi:pSer/pThr/pTyr-binding forkhead associated (FHA) protein
MTYKCEHGHVSDMGDLPCDIDSTPFRAVDEPAPEPEPAPPTAPEPPPGSGRPVLRITFGPGYELTAGTQDVLLGRDVELSEHAAFLGEHDTVSRRHASVGIDEEGPWIRDEYSSNGTLLNHVRLVPGRKHRLQHGTRLKFGELTARVSVLGSWSSGS